MLIINGATPSDCLSYYHEAPNVTIGWDILKNCTTYSKFKAAIENSNPALARNLQWGTSDGSSLYSFDASRGISMNMTQTPTPDWVNWVGFDPHSANYLKDVNFAIKSFGFPKKLTLTGTPIMAEDKIGFMVIYLRTADGKQAVPLIYWVKAYKSVSYSNSRYYSFFNNENHHDGFWSFDGLLDLYWAKSSTEKTIVVDFNSLYKTNAAVKKIMDSYAEKETIIGVHMPFSKITQSGVTYSGMVYYLKSLSIEM